MQMDMLEMFEAVEHQDSILPNAPPEDINHKMAVLLEEFENSGGVITCVDAERIVHRGQAVVHEMKKRGHLIQTIRIGGEKCRAYKYTGFKDAGIKVTPAIQQQYYATSHWKRKAKERKEIDGWKCVQCKSTSELETHHWKYNLFCEDAATELVTLCGQCHEGLHSNIRGSGVHFPHTISHEVMERIVSEQNQQSEWSGE